MNEKIVTSGKRKSAVARAVIKEGSGKITINKKPYQHLEIMKRLMIEEPLRIASEKLGGLKFDIDIMARGGGQESQIEASRLAIARALVEATKSSELRKAYLLYDRSMLVADTRRKEAYKPGDSKARAKRQKSYR
ncbi:30S ribosomal protein S9 [Candidatus Pacearchaeota archaeon]|nr:30S ribosomal protein S9 [Candidatus Pacearchaeota archaeon]